MQLRAGCLFVLMNFISAKMTIRFIAMNEKKKLSSVERTTYANVITTEQISWTKKSRKRLQHYITSFYYIRLKHTWIDHGNCKVLQHIVRTFFSHLAWGAKVVQWQRTCDHPSHFHFQHLAFIWLFLSFHHRFKTRYFQFDHMADHKRITLIW